MAYEKQVWQTGDIVDSEKLNHIEEGIENTNPLIVEQMENGISASYEDLTYALSKGQLPFLKYVSVLGEFSIYHLAHLSSDAQLGHYTAIFAGADSSGSYDTLLFESDSPEESMETPEEVEPGPLM